MAGEEGQVESQQADAPPQLPPLSATIELKTKTDLKKLVSDTINRLRRGELDPKVGNAIVLAVGVWLKIGDDDKTEEQGTRESNGSEEQDVFQRVRESAGMLDELESSQPSFSKSSVPGNGSEESLDPRYSYQETGGISVFNR